MQINADQLSGQLKRGIAPVYLLTGDEPLLVQECADAIRAAARAAGFGERELSVVESGFDWAGFYAGTRAGSLFAGRRLLELRLPTGKPGEEGARTLAELAEDANPDIALLVVTGKLEKAARSAKWVGAIERAGLVVVAYPVEPARLPAWIGQRLRARGIAPGPGVAEMLARFTEGNLLACAQEVDKLALLGRKEISADDIAGVLGDNARFSVYTLADACLAGDAAAAVRMVRSLAGEGAAPALVLWALAREVREVTRMAGARAAGASESQVLEEYRVWARRRPIIARALRRAGVNEWQRCLRQAAYVDRAVKGRAEGDAWQALEELALIISGVTPIGLRVAGDRR